MEKKILLFIIAILSMLLVGCGAKTEIQPVEIEETVDVNEDAEKEQPAPAVKETVTAPVEEEPAKEETTGYNLESLPRDQQLKIKLVRNLMAEAREREENYFFRYSGPGVTQTELWVKGDKMKRQFIRPDKVDKLNPYNMVYMDQITKIAKGYCETTKSVCPNGNGPFSETYSKWDVKTPKDWLAELDDNFLWALDNKVSDVLYHIIDYQKDGKLMRVYINDYKGWPAKIEMYSGDNINTPITTTHFYDDMNIGGVSDDDVTPN